MRLLYFSLLYWVDSRGSWSKRRPNVVNGNEDFRHLLEPGFKLAIGLQKSGLTKASSETRNRLSQSDRPWKYTQKFAYASSDRFYSYTGAGGLTKQASSAAGLQKGGDDPSLYVYKSQCDIPSLQIQNIEQLKRDVKEYYWWNSRDIAAQTPKSGVVATRSDTPKQSCETLKLDNPNGPTIELSGFYVANSVHRMEPGRNYIGVVIFAVKSGQTWFHTPHNVFEIPDRDGRSRIRPGYIILASENAMQNYEGSRRDKLFQFYFGKKEKDMRRQDGVEFVLLDFDYLATNPTDGELLCDFYCSSTNGRSEIWQKLPKSGSSRFQNSEYGGVRAAANEQVIDCSNEKLFNLVKFSVNKYRENADGNRLSLIKDIYNGENDFASMVFPKCDLCFEHGCHSSATCNPTEKSYTCHCPVGTLTFNNGMGEDGCRRDTCHNDNCNQHAICNRGEADYTCKCPAGYVTNNHGRGSDGCRRDPCYQNDCNDHASCTVVRESYSCTCKSGYIKSNSGKGSNGCRRDTCFNHDCHPFATCNPGESTYTCTCPRYWPGTRSGVYTRPSKTHPLRGRGRNGCLKD